MAQKVINGIEIKTAVLRCQKCERRHGDQVADTLYIGWRCPRCKSQNEGKVLNGEFITGHTQS